MSGTTATGRIFAVSTSAADITGFDPARDKLDFGDVSVHNFIVVDTPTGVGFMNPWSSETIIVQGVSLGQLTVDSFAPVINDHLRQCLSGALAWEQGVTPAPNTVYARSHELGHIDKVAFNPATDVVDFRYYGSREQIYMTDGAEGVVISNAGTGQALILLGVTRAQLSVTNFVFYAAEVREDRVHLQLGFDTVPASQVVAQGVPTAGTIAWPTGVGSGAPPSGSSGETFGIGWDYGVNAVLDFDAATDKLDFGWFKASEIGIAEVNGATVITIEGNRQTYTLANTPLGALEMTNIVALDPGLRAEWQAALDAAPPPPALPTLSVADAQVVEGDDGTANLVFTVTLSAAAAGTVSVSYSTLAGTARPAEDFTPAVGTVTFAPGQTSKTFSVPILGDRITELTESLTVQLSGATGAKIADGTAIGTIRDNDVDPSPGTPPSITIEDWTTNEGDADLTHMRIVLRLSKASSQEVTVRFATEDVTATGPVDYEVLSGTVTFAPGETVQTIHAHINGDTTIEPTESYRIRLSQAVNATIADDVGVVTIVNDDSAAPPPALSIADATIIEGNAGTKLLSMTVALSRAATGPVTVGYATANGTATAGSDYTAQAGTLTFAAGETSKTVQVSIAGDTAVEANETLRVLLSNATGATIADGEAIATLTNDDTAPASGTGSLAYTVTDNWGAGFVATMTVAAGGTALSGWTAEFDAGFTITNIWNAVIVSHVGTRYVIANAGYNGAVAAGGSTSFGFQASGGTTAVTGLTLNAAPSGGTLPALSVADASVMEGANGTTELAFVVSLSAASATPVTVNYATANGTAAAGSDYTAQTGALTFAAGETSKTIRVSVTGDTAVEANETLTLTLSGATGATLADGSAIGTILNDDAAGPTLSVGNASVLEGASGTANLVFTVSLSTPAAGPVTVSYATANGTATAGSDYAAKTGTLTFAAGETSKTVAVAVTGDTVAEANETLTLTLSGASGAAIGTAIGTGTIRNDDLPAITIKDTSVVEGNPTSGPGWLSTAGNQIVDASGMPVQVAGVNWFGFEGTNMSPNGLWTRGYKEMMQQMVELGFNTIRLPFSTDMLHAAGPALGIDFNKNADLQGLNPLQVMDLILAYAEQVGLRVILDHHRSDAGAGTSANGLWYDAAHPEEQWIADWQMLATRYAGNAAVIGADLHNEPYNGTWGGGGANDWAAAAERAGNAIGAVNANWLIFVEGVGSYQGTPYWWGGNLMGVRDRPIELNVPNKLVYSPHDYPNSIYEQPWFQGPDFPANLPAKFDQMWGYIYREGIAPVFIGEFGTKLTDPKDAPWFEAITSYISGDLDNDGDHDLAAGKLGVSWTYWSWNPNSGDTGGILQDDWRTVHENKMAYLRPITFDMPDAGGGNGFTYASFEVTLSAPAKEAVSVAWRTVAGTATAVDFTAASGTLSFAAGELTKTIRIAVAGDALDEANESFTVVLSTPVGATIRDGSGKATIIDDDAPAGSPVPLLGTSLADVIAGGGGADSLSGLGGADTISGGAGADSLRGGTAGDRLTGGEGADRFIFASGDGNDTVADYNALDGGAAEGDRLVFAGATVGTFAYRGGAAVTRGADHTQARIAGGKVLVDLDGNGVAEITVTLTGLTSAAQLSAADFLFG